MGATLEDAVLFGLGEDDRDRLGLASFLQELWGFDPDTPLGIVADWAADHRHL